MPVRRIVQAMDNSMDAIWRRFLRSPGPERVLDRFNGRYASIADLVHAATRSSEEPFATLVRAAATDDDAGVVALKALYPHIRPQALRWRVEVDDVLTEAWCAIRAFPPTAQSASPRSVARNVKRSLARTSIPEPAATTSDAVLGSFPARNDDHDAVRLLLDEWCDAAGLSGRVRTVIQAVGLDGWTGVEVAASLGFCKATVWDDLCFARTAIRSAA